MPTSIQSIESTAKDWSLAITPTATGIDIGAGPVLFCGERFDVPAMSIQCVPEDSEDARYRIALCRHVDGPAIVLVEDDAVPNGYEEIVYLARWRLTALSDTCASVTVEVPRRVLVPKLDEAGNPIPLPEPVIYAVSPTPVLVAASGERTQGRKLRRRIRDLRQQLRDLKQAGTTYSAMTAAQRLLVNEYCALTGEAAPLAVP